MKTKTKTIYITDDGKEFDNSIECLKHETNLDLRGKLKSGAVFHAFHSKLLLIKEYGDRWHFLGNTYTGGTFAAFSDAPRNTEETLSYLKEGNAKFIKQLSVEL